MHMYTEKIHRQKMEVIEMKDKPKIPSRGLYGLALFVILGGLLLSAWMITGAGLESFPERIAEAYDEEQHRLSVPGSIEVSLTRAGAYGIYYESSPPADAQIPPAIACSLKSNSTGTETTAAPDYVETNRYWAKGRTSTGVLIMSLTVDEPGIYRFTCRYQDGSSGPESVVAMGPNYVWEFLKVVGKIGLPLLAGLSVLCASGLLALLIVIIVTILRHTMPREQANV
jgi:hypothetical protein